MEHKIALIYCRVSSERQKNEGHGLDSQEHRCREYAERKGYVVEKVFRDSFSGGGDFMRRPAMAAMLNYVDENAHQQYIVIFDDLKRFARDVQFHLKLRATLKSRDITPECLNFNFEDTPEGQYVETILAAGAELERKQNRRQVIQKQKARLEKGYWPFYPPPGYKSIKHQLHGKLLTPDKKAPIIKEALEGFVSGRFQNQVDLQKFLQTKNFSESKKTSLEAVKRLLTRIVYAGFIEYPKWEVTRRKGHHEAIVSLETYQQIQDKLSGKVKLRVRKDIRLDFPLRGFVLCAVCRKPFTASWSSGRKKKYPFYRCNQPECEMRGKSVNRGVLEGEFETLLKRIKPSKKTLNLTRAIFIQRWDNKIQEFNTLEKKIQNELTKVEEEINLFSIRASKAATETVVKVYEKQIEECGNKENKLRDSLQKIKNVLGKKNFETTLDVVFEILKNPYSAWQKGDFAMKRLILQIVFEQSLAYNRNSGFETAILSLPLRVFELSEVDNSQVVEMARIELACKR